MEIIRLTGVISVTSEIEGHSGQNLLDGGDDPQKSWLSEKGTNRSVIVLQLERPAKLMSIRLGNCHSAFVEIMVGKTSDSSDDFQCLIPKYALMSSEECRSGKNPNRNVLFTQSEFCLNIASQLWDKIRIVCIQPFDVQVPYGLFSVKVYGEVKKPWKVILPSTKTAGEDDEDIEVGSFFRRKMLSGGETSSVSGEVKEGEKEDVVKDTSVNEKQATEKKRKRGASSKGKEEMAFENERARPKEPKMDVVPKTDEKDKMRSKVTQKETTKDKNKKKTKPFEKLMEDVVLVISGFKNPLRGNIRTMAMEMGAKYSPDWESHCTHMVCAYANTPKFHQVRKEGKGKIVTKKWVEKCYSDKIRYPWRRFALEEKDLSEAESEEEIEADEKVSKPKMKQVEDLEAPSTSKEMSKSEGADVEGDMSGVTKMTPLGVDVYDEKSVTECLPSILPNIFTGRVFYVDDDIKVKSTIERYILCYDGVLADTLNKQVQYYVTEKSEDVVSSYKKKMPDLIQVKPSWVWKTHEKRKWIPCC